MGKRPLPRAAEDHTESAALARREALQDATGVTLRHVAGEIVPPEAMRGQIEALIGVAQLPLGAVGPLVLSGEFEDELYVPMATTEGTMLASFARGLKVCALSGGIRAWVIDDGLTLRPRLTYPNLLAAVEACEWAREHVAELVAAGNATTRHGRTLEVTPTLVGRRVSLRCRFATGEAHGINMAMRAAGAMLEVAAAATGATGTMLYGEIEKIPRGLLEPRGKHVVCETELEREAIEAVLKTSAGTIAEVFATYGLSPIQSSNAIAAVFAACGQDIAYVGEARIGTVEATVTASGGLHVVFDFPALMTATVGGGTGSGTAAECLRLMGCVGPGSARRLACILAATCLAGDVNLAAMCASTPEMVRAHSEFGSPGSKLR